MTIAPEMQSKYKEINASASKMAIGVSELIRASGIDPNAGPVSVAAFEFNRRLEDAMHRVSDLMVFIAQQNPANVEKLVDEKIASGDVVTPGPIDISGGREN